MIPDDVRKHLPRYLSEGALEALYANLCDYENSGIPQKLFTGWRDGTVIQGDVVDDLSFVRLPDGTVFQGTGLIISNTCDFDATNTRVLPPQVQYCLVVKLSKFLRRLRDAGLVDANVDQFLYSLKKQRLSNRLYLPTIFGDDDGIALLDYAVFCDSTELRDSAGKVRARLENYGFYVFLVKLSIHFCRVREEIDRNPLAQGAAA